MGAYLPCSAFSSIALQHLALRTVAPEGRRCTAGTLWGNRYAQLEAEPVRRTAACCNGVHYGRKVHACLSLGRHGGTHAPASSGQHVTDVFCAYQALLRRGDARHTCCVQPLHGLSSLTLSPACFCSQVQVYKCQWAATGKSAATSLQSPQCRDGARQPKGVPRGSDSRVEHEAQSSWECADTLYTSAGTGL